MSAAIKSSFQLANQQNMVIEKAERMKNFESSPKMLMVENMKKFLLNKGFVSVATSDLSGQPHAVPKYIVEIEKGFIYLADYVIGKTFQNLKINPKISLSTLNVKTLEGLQINGVAKMITKGPKYKQLLKAMVEQEVYHSASRIVENVRRGRKAGTFELEFPEKVAMIKVKCEKITKISISGNLKIERIKE
jgi:predicted pyridoxine 5'-phosphate oxidase superfamily flavin-nucleotide-binding protein